LGTAWDIFVLALSLSCPFGIIGRDVISTWTALDRALDEIEDPEVGLALLSKRPSGETPEQALNLLFWQIQFTEWRNWLQGDVLAIARAIAICSIGKSKKPPPTWLSKAVGGLCLQHMSRHDKRAKRKMLEHFRRWETAELVRRGRAGDPLNRNKKVRGDAVWEETAELLAGTIAKGDEETMRKSHQLIKRAGGSQATLPSYKQAANVRYQRRKKRPKKTKLG
jgi:hypothetical protein